MGEQGGDREVRMVGGSPWRLQLANMAVCIGVLRNPQWIV